MSGLQNPLNNNDNRKENIPLFGLVSALFILSAMFIFNKIISTDSYWILHLAERLNDGQKAYVDFIEVNPPLIIWLTLIPVSIANAFAIDSETVFKFSLLVLVAASLWLVWIAISNLKMRAGKSVFIAIAFALLILPNDLFGQREHIMLTMTLPYIFTVCARAQHIKLPQTYWIICAILAAIGICIKPYFVAIPAALELYLLYKLKSNSFKRVEPYMMAFIGFSYLAAIFILTPEYINTVVPLLSVIYQSGTGTSVQVMIITSLSLMMLSALMIYVYVKNDHITDNIYIILGLAALANYLCYFVQLKGWLNHLYPFKAIVLILAAGLLTEVLSSKIKQIYKVIIIALSMLVFYSELSFTKTEIYRKPYFEALLKDYPQARSIFIMSTWLQDGFPLVNHNKLTWGSRFPNLWFVTGIQNKKDLNSQDPELLRIDNYFKNALAEDLKQNKTDLVIVDTSSTILYRRNDQSQYSFISDFSENQKFSEEWKNYKLVGSNEFHEIYERTENQ